MQKYATYLSACHLYVFFKKVHAITTAGETGEGRGFVSGQLLWAWFVVGPWLEAWSWWWWAWREAQLAGIYFTGLECVKSSRRSCSSCGFRSDRLSVGHFPHFTHS